MAVGRKIYFTRGTKCSMSGTVDGSYGLVKLANIASETLSIVSAGLTFLSAANDSETNNSFCQAMLASFAQA